MLTINNEPTVDAYSTALTLNSAFGGRLVYVVANNSVVAQFKPLREHGGSETAEWGPEIVLTPQASFIDKISAARFRSAVAGSVGRVIAQLTEPGDILPASGTPFTQSLAASGAVSGGGGGALLGKSTRATSYVPGVGIAEAAPTTWLALPPIDFGTTPVPVIFELEVCYVFIGTFQAAVANLWDMTAGVDQGRMAYFQGGAANGADPAIHLTCRATITPGSGTRVYAARVWGGAAQQWIAAPPQLPSVFRAFQES